MPTKYADWGDRVTLERIAVGVGQTISPAQMATFQVEQVWNLVTDSLTVALRGYLLGKGGDVVVTSRTVAAFENFPVSWWDMVKGRLRERFPALCGRLTVRTRRVETVVNVTTTTTRLCPHLNVASSAMHLSFLLSRPDSLSPEDLWQIAENQRRQEREEAHPHYKASSNHRASSIPWRTP